MVVGVLCCLHPSACCPPTSEPVPLPHKRCDWLIFEPLRRVGRIARTKTDYHNCAHSQVPRLNFNVRPKHLPNSKVSYPKFVVSYPSRTQIRTQNKIAVLLPAPCFQPFFVPFVPKFSILSKHTKKEQEAHLLQQGRVKGGGT